MHSEPVPERSHATGLLLMTMLLWGSNLPVIKWLTGHFDPTLMSGLRMVAASLPLAWMLLRRGPLPRLPRAHVGWLVLCGLLMVYLNQLLLAAGLARSNATNGSLITALNPLAASLLAVWLLHERLSGRRIGGLLAGLAGVAVIVLQRPGAELAHGGVGDLMMIAGILTFTGGVVILQRMAGSVDPLVISFGLHTTGAVGLLLQTGAQMLASDAPLRMPASTWPWVALALSGAFCTGIANLMWNISVQRIGVTRAAAWMYWVPIVGVASAVVLLGEPFTRWHFIGMLLVLGGSWFGTHRPGELRPSS